MKRMSLGKDVVKRMKCLQSELSKKENLHVCTAVRNTHYNSLSSSTITTSASLKVIFSD